MVTASDRRVAFAGWLLAGTLVTAGAASFLLPHSGVGIGFTLFLVIALATLTVLVSVSPVALNRDLRWLGVLATLVAICPAIRDSMALRWLDYVALLLIGGYAALRAAGERLSHATTGEIILGPLHRWLLTIISFYPVIDLQGLWPEVRRSRGPNDKSTAIARGFGLALPVLAVFGFLFVAADQTFERAITRSFSFDLSAMSGPFLTFCAVVVAFGGIAQQIVLPWRYVELIGPPVPPVVPMTWSTSGPQSGSQWAVPPVPRNPIGLIEVSVLLGLVDLLFLAFVGLQSTYLFGGEAAIRAVTGLGVAEYARRGFFELVWVAAIALMLLLWVAHKVPAEGRRTSRTYQLLSMALVVMIGIVLASATQRMLLYVHRFGISELRVYVFAILAWLAVVFLWFSLTVQRGKDRQFAPGAALAFVLAILGLNALNPDAWIARINLTRAGEVDRDYLTQLSSDAVPTLVALTANRSRATLEADWRFRYPWLVHDDWRGWNLSRQRAREALAPFGYSSEPAQTSVSPYDWDNR